MRLWPVAKGLLLGLLLIGAFGAMCVGAVFLVIGLWWEKLGGIALLAGGFRGGILFLDLVWERPPHLSKRPWERPWEDEDYAER
jgi:hypothetical protein